MRVCGADFSMISRQRVLDPCWTALQAITEGIHVVSSTSMPSFARVDCFLLVFFCFLFFLWGAGEIMAKPVCLIALNHFTVH